MVQYSKNRNLNRGYMKLDVWNKSILLLRKINALIDKKSLPFKIKAQILDSTQSVLSNIAEGYCRRHLNEYIQFSYIALASLGETLTRCIGLKEINLISDVEFKNIDTLHYEVENKLLSLVKSLEKKRKEKSWDDQIHEPVLNYIAFDKKEDLDEPTP